MSRQKKAGTCPSRVSESVIYCHSSQRFSCLGCAKCCSVWDVPVKSDEKEAIEKLALPGIDFDKDACFLPIHRKKLFLIRKTVQGRCVFLNEQNRCLIHSIHGESAKPLACRLYPFDLFPWKDGTVSAILRYDCPAVAFHKGKPIRERESFIFRLVSELRRRGSSTDAKYSESCPVGLKQLHCINRAYTEILLDDSIPWAVRFYACSRLLEFHSRKEHQSDIVDADEEFFVDARAFVKRSIKDLSDTLAAAVPINLNQRVVFRYLMTGYARVDEEVKEGWFRLGRIRRAWSVCKFITGYGSLRDLGSTYPDTSGMYPIVLLRDSRINDEAKKNYRRFLAAKLESMTFCGNPCLKFTFEHGMRHLLLTYPLVFAFAAIIAHESRKPMISGDEMAQALMIVDHTFARSPFFQLQHVRKMTTQLTSGLEFPSILGIFGSDKSLN